MTCPLMILEFFAVIGGAICACLFVLFLGAIFFGLIDVIERRFWK